MTILRTDTISGIGTEGTVFEGGITVDSLNYMTLPKGTTDQRYSLEGRDPDYHKLKLHLPLVHHTQFDDYSPASPSITANYDSHISSKSGVFENSAALFSRAGANDWLAISDSNDLDLGTDDFTIECWFMCAGGGTDGNLIQKGYNAGTWSYIISFKEATDSINFYATTDGTNFDIVNGTSFGTTILPNIWYHVAVCRNGNTFSYYINGQKGATTDTSSASLYNSSIEMRIKEPSGFGSTEDVFIQDVRLYKGVAKYNETFTPQKLAEDGAIRYNTDSNKIECYNGMKWMNVAVSSPDLGGNGGPAGNPTGNSAEQILGARGVFCGGSTPTKVKTLDYVTITSAGDAIDFGELYSIARRATGACADKTRGLNGGGDPNTAMIDYFTFSSTGDAVSFGDLSLARNYLGGTNNSTRGVFGGAWGPSRSKVVDYVTISSTGDAKNFGELQVARQIDASFSSPTRGFFAGGASGSGPDYEASTNGRIIEFVITSSLGDATDFGDLINGTFGKHGSSNSIRGIIGGGYPSVQHVEYITMATLGNANDFGDTTHSHYYGAAASNSTRSIIGGGNGPTDTIEYVAIAQAGNGVDFGNLSQSRSNLKGISNGNGGL